VLALEDGEVAPDVELEIARRVVLIVGVGEDEPPAARTAFLICSWCSRSRLYRSMLNVMRVSARPAWMSARASCIPFRESRKAPEIAAS
jgi:hypothetical protein